MEWIKAKYDRLLLGCCVRFQRCQLLFCGWIQFRSQGALSMIHSRED